MASNRKAIREVVVINNGPAKLLSIYIINQIFYRNLSPLIVRKNKNGNYLQNIYRKIMQKCTATRYGSNEKSKKSHGLK